MAKPVTRHFKAAISAVKLKATPVLEEDEVTVEDAQIVRDAQARGDKGERAADGLPERREVAEGSFGRDRVGAAGVVGAVSRLLRGMRSETEEMSRCIDKRAYASWDKAWAVVAKIRSFRPDDMLEPYRCPFCDRLHLGHRRAPA